MPRYSPAMVLTLKVVLEDVRPQIWRRLRVPGAFSLAELHYVLQIAMGWEDAHVHQFTIDRINYAEVRRGEPSDLRDERSLRLSDLARRRKPFSYEYDFGDGWKHQITVEKVDEEGTDFAATCLLGQRACPPEDCGGPYGYMRLVRSLANPRHREYEDMADWAGDVDPAAFDVAAVNQRLRQGPTVRVRRGRDARLSG
jgi:hypothetical protein